MNAKNHLSKKAVFVLLFFMFIARISFAFDFSSVCSTGQTLCYNITDPINYYVEVTSVSGGIAQPSGVVNIPSEVFYENNTYTVRSIGQHAFYLCNEITNLTIPNTVVSIGSAAFQFASFSSVTIPSSVTSIAESAFSFNNNLNSISFSENLVDVGATAFLSTGWYNSKPNGSVYAGPVYYCYKGNMPSNCNINIQEGTKGIANGAFQNFTNLSSVLLPGSLLNIGDAAFSGCSGLSSITIPSSVLSIQTHAFSDCSQLTTVNFNAANCSYADTPFYNCSSLSSLFIGNGVQTIPDTMFKGCSHLSGALVLPSSLSYIGKNAFEGCGGFTGNLSIPVSVATIGEFAFKGCSNISSITYNAANCQIDGSGYNCPFSGCTSASTLTIGNDVVSIPDRLFYQCSFFSGALVLPSSMTSIGNMSFWQCVGFTGNLTIPSSVQILGEGAFFGCVGFTSLTYNAANCSSVSSTGSPFLNCTSISNLLIGNSVVSIPNNMFNNCHWSIGHLVIPNSVETIGEFSFQNNVGMTAITIGTSVNSIGMGAFSGISTLQSATYNATNCDGYGNIIFPNTLTNISFGDNVQYIPSCLTMGATNLVCQLILPNSLVEIGEQAFYNCGITGTLTIPMSVSTIGSLSFAFCTGVTEIHSLPETPPSLSSTTFLGCTVLP